MDDVVSSVVVEKEFRADELSDATTVAPNTIAICSRLVFFCFGLPVDATATARRRRSRREGLLDDDDDESPLTKEPQSALLWY